MLAGSGDQTPGGVVNVLSRYGKEGGTVRLRGEGFTAGSAKTSGPSAQSLRQPIHHPGRTAA